MSWVVNLLAQYRAMDALLADAGWPPTSEWWFRQIERFLQSGRRQFVLRVGRRGGKSSTLCRVAVAFALWGAYQIPPGDVGVVAFVSVSRDESAQRLRTIEAILLALGVAYRRTGDSIELDGRPVVFKTFAASIAGVSGFTAILFVGDEVAKWRDSDTGANPAGEVLASARPTMATQPTARMFLCSSPLSNLDAHAVAFDEGDTDYQLVAHAATHDSNPTIPEKLYVSLESNETRRLREYYAIPQTGSVNVLPVELIDAAFARWHRYAAAKPSTHYITADPSSGGTTSADWFTFGAFGWVDNERERYVLDDRGQIERSAWGDKIERSDFKPTPPVLKFTEIDGIQGGFFGQITGDEIAKRIARLARRHDTRFVLSDQREQFFMESMLKKEGLRLAVYPWTATSKPRAVEIVRRWFADGLIALPPHDRLRAELLGFEERITASGQFTYGARRGGHDDFVALLITAAHAELAAQLKQSPIAPQPFYGMA